MTIEIKTRGASELTVVELDCGELTIDSVLEGKQALKYCRQNIGCVLLCRLQNQISGDK